MYVADFGLCRINYQYAEHSKYCTVYLYGTSVARIQDDPCVISEVLVVRTDVVELVTYVEAVCLGRRPRSTPIPPVSRTRWLHASM